MQSFNEKKEVDELLEACNNAYLSKRSNTRDRTYNQQKKVWDRKVDNWTLPSNSDSTTTGYALHGSAGHGFEIKKEQITLSKTYNFQISLPSN